MKNKLAFLEAVLFTTDEPMSMDELEKILKIGKDEIEKLLGVLKERYSIHESGIKISDAGGYKLIVKQDYIDSVSNLTPHADLSRGLLRVLSIIAYHEPIKQSDIVKVVGNRTYDYVKELESRGLIKSERKSRTKIMKTTPHFEDYFGAKKSEIKKMAGSDEKDNKPGT